MDEGGQARVRGAYEACRRMQRRHDPTFYVATGRLPREVRPAVHALYGFVRGADELVDGERRAPSAAQRRAALDAWEGALREGVSAGSSDHPVIAALVDAGRRHDLPLHLLEVYMDAMRVDCDDRVQIADDRQLDRYMQGSAATVGRIMAPLIGLPGRPEEVADLGVAFQLTNFVRDAREDLDLGRTYLPGLQDDARGAVARQVERARALFAQTARLEDELAGTVRTGVRLARGVYERVLDRVEALDYDVLRRRAALAPWELVPAAAGALRQGSRSRPARPAG